MSSMFVLIVEVVLIAFGFNITYDVAVLFHGYDIAGNTAQVAANAGVSQVSSYRAIGGIDNYVGTYARQKADAQINGNNISGSCSDINNNTAIACTVTYEVSLPTIFGTPLHIAARQTVVSKPVDIGYRSPYSPTA